MGLGHKTIADQVARLAKVPLAHQPGEGWTYGLQPRRARPRDRGRLGPGLRSSTCRSGSSRRSTCATPRSSCPRRSATGWPRSTDAGDGGALSPLPKEYGSETFFSGGGGLFSTARDYARFAQMLLQRRRAGRRPGPQARDGRGDDDEPDRRALRLRGSEVRPGLRPGDRPRPRAAASPCWSRYFWGGVFSTNFWVIPRHDLVLVLMTQVVPTNHGGADLVFHRVVNAAIER